MVQRKNLLRLLREGQIPEIRHEIGIILQVSVENLESDVVLQLRVKGLPDFGYVTISQGILQFVISKAL
jgi:hypothetical protein